MARLLSIEILWIPRQNDLAVVERCLDLHRALLPRDDKHVEVTVLVAASRLVVAYDYTLWVDQSIQRLIVDVVQHPAVRNLRAFVKLIITVLITVMLILVRNKLELNFQWGVLSFGIDHKV